MYIVMCIFLIRLTDICMHKPVGLFHRYKTVYALYHKDSEINIAQNYFFFHLNSVELYT